MKLLAIDLGASGGRALVGVLEERRGGATLTMDEVHRFPHAPVYLPRDGGRTLHWNAVQIWDEILTGLRKAGASHGAPASVGVDTWGVDYGLIDSRGSLLENPVAYRDSRAVGMMARAFASVPQSEIFARTGLQFMELNTLFQLLGAQTQHSSVLPLADRMLLMPDLFHYWLCGSKTVEYTNASTTQMVGAESRTWDRDLLERLGLPCGLLPEIVPAGTRLGELRASVAAEAGLPSGVSVITRQRTTRVQPSWQLPGKGTTGPS